MVAQIEPFLSAGAPAFCLYLLADSAFWPVTVALYADKYAVVKQTVQNARYNNRNMGHSRMFGRKPGLSGGQGNDQSKDGLAHISPY